MSTLGVSSSSNTSPYAYLQSLRASTDTSQVQSTGSESGSGDSSSSSVQQAGGRHHHHPRDDGGMLGKVQDAVTSALQSAQSDPSADPNQTIQDAIAKVFQQNGARGPGGAQGATGGGGPRPPGPDGDGDGANGSAQGSSETGSSKMQAFFQTLQDQYGISADQFRQDFQSAVQQARNGQSDSSTAFRSFPPGTLVDTAA